MTTPIKDKKPIPINKYSIYEMKSAIDTKITECLEEKKFKEVNTYSNLKIGVGFTILGFTALAYLYPKPFPENYNIILFSVVGYIIFSLIYYYLERYVIKQIFYMGYEEDYFLKIRQGKREKIKLVKISSEIKDYSHLYQIWFDFITQAGLKFSSEKIEIDVTALCDDRGYLSKEAVREAFLNVFNEQMCKKVD